MRASVINQYLTQDTTAACLDRLLREFAARPRAQFRGLVAWVSAAGLRLIEPALRHFLDAGHSVFWIVGVDLGGTGHEALQFIYDLKRAYPAGRVDARVFSTGDNQSIFHPKVYWLDSNDRKVVIVGSANATAGGLNRNFETSLELEVEPLVDDVLLEDLNFLWVSYSSPLPPLTAANLLEIDRNIIQRVGHDQPPTDARPHQAHPLHQLIPAHGVRLMRGRGARRRRRARPRAAIRRRQRQLVMDILQETRQTQVQLPVDALTSFFVPPGAPDSMELRLRRRGQVVKFDVRPIIHLGNNTHRIEVDAIRGLPRPQIIRFTRIGGRTNAVEYEVILKGTREYDELDQLLTAEGRQTRQGARRWLMP